MDGISKLMQEHYANAFALHGATSKGVDWNSDEDVHVRYSKMLDVMRKDFYEMKGPPTLLDVGCGWGGLLEYALNQRLEITYTGIDVVAEMIEHARTRHPSARFLVGDVLDSDQLLESFDFVVCSGVLTQKLTATIPEMDRFAKALIRRMFDLCRHGVAFNVSSTLVNFVVGNLYYKSPVELLAYCLSEITPRVRLDHGYTSIGSNQRRLYEYTIYLYKD